MTVYKAAASEYTASCKVTVSVPTLCWCNRWPGYGGFRADGYLWASMREFPTRWCSQNGARNAPKQGHGQSDGKKGHFWPFLEGSADLGVNFGRPNCV